MKLQYKITLIMIVFAILLFTSFITIYKNWDESKIVENEQIKLLRNAKIYSERIELELIDKLSITKSFILAPIVIQSLEKSNDIYAPLTKDKQNQKIDQLNQKWKQAKNIDEPFINSYLTNPLANYLKKQQKVLPGVYGEIFITNRYGAMIATTGKLSTLAHSHKYWWKESYYDGEGKIFIDDRGFDKSVNGYVIGIVVPIKKDGEIIGIVKSNINIMTTLNNILKRYSTLNDSNLKIVRSKGKVVLEKGIPPLSTTVNNQLLKKFNSIEAGHMIIEDDGIEKLIASAPVRLTLDNDYIKFGGKPVSSGSGIGNDKEIWYTVITQDKNIVISKSKEINKLMIDMAIVIIVFTILLSFIVARLVSYPLKYLTSMIQYIDKDNLDIEIKVDSTDEVGVLAKTFNKMLLNLNKTTASRNKLLAEIDKRKKIEEELIAAKKGAEEANKAKSLFLSNMSHEIRTPLNGIIGLTQLTLDTKLTSKQKYYLSKVQNSSKSLLHIINDILDYSKMQAGKLHLDHESFKIADILETISGMFGFEVSKKNVELLFHVDADVPEVLIGDQLRLTQILINLIGNSIKFTENGEVLLGISVKSIDSYACELEFIVKDTGIGIKKEDQDKLFQKFSQVDSSYKRKYEGTGLGLVISKEFISMMGGEISFSSLYGEGSNFSFSVKLKIDKEQTQENISIKSVKKGDRVLVVDDIETSRIILDKILKSWKLDTTLSDNGEDALKKVEQSLKDGLAYDYILLDWKMPGLIGSEVLKRIKDIYAKNETETEPVIIMITAYTKDELTRELKKYKVKPKSILIKPVTASTLQTAMLSEIKKSQTQEKTIPYDNNMEPIAGAEVLLVEDNEINVIVAKEYLENMHLNVTTALNGLEAVNIVKNQKFDIIFMDLQMSIMDGIEATKEIKNIDDKKSIPIVAMTAAAMEQDRKNSKNAGMQAHITKPIDIDELKEILLKFVKPNVENRILREDKTKKSAKDNDSLPEKIDGVNINDLKLKLAGDTHLISKLLLNFANKYDELEYQFNEKKVGSENFKSLMHSLKAESGNMSIFHVYNLSKKIYDTTSIDEQKILTKLLHEKLIEVIYNIKELIGIKDEESEFQLTQNEMIEAIDGFTEKLDKHYFINFDEIEKLLMGLKDYARDDEMSILSDCFDRLDYIGAYNTLQEIKQNIVKRI